MVFVQSFWSKPFLNADSNDFNYRVSGGFPDKRYFYYCWVLSFLSLKRLGKKVILVTDDPGKYLLIEALGLTYDEVQLHFNKLNDLSSSYWAIPKLYVYKSMKEPFLHFDGDLIVYPGFKNLDFENHDLIFEFKNESFSKEHLKSIRFLDNLILDETRQYESIANECYPDESGIHRKNNSDCSKGYSKPLKTNIKNPEQVLNYLNKGNPIKLINDQTLLSDSCLEPVISDRSCTCDLRTAEPSSGHLSLNEVGELNCGVIGGRDYKILNEFASWSLGLFNNNLGKLDSELLKYNKNLINSYFEQYLLYQFLFQKGRAFSCIYEGDPRALYQRDFFLPVNNSSRIMTHFLLNLKVKYSLEIELNLRINYPEWHARINDLIDRNTI